MYRLTLNRFYRRTVTGNDQQRVIVHRNLNWTVNSHVSYRPESVPVTLRTHWRHGLISVENNEQSNNYSPQL